LNPDFQSKQIDAKAHSKKYQVYRCLINLSSFVTPVRLTLKLSAHLQVDTLFQQGQLKGL